MSQTYIPAATLTPTRRVVVPNEVPAVRTPRFIDDVAAGRVELPTIPGVVQRLIAALRDPDVDSRKIGESLSQDPVLSAKVLKIANSSYFGGQRSMASIDAAIALIGLQALNRLIVAAGVATTFKAIPGVDLATFWRDALVAATAANKLAGTLGADPEAAYLCGLLHATGHLILCQAYPEIAAAMFAGFATVRGAELSSIEVEAFGIDHPTAGALWVETLGFPESVSTSIRQLSQEFPAAPEALELALRAAVALAASVAQKVDVAVAFAALPPIVAMRFGANGKPNAAFDKLYDTLLEVQPVL